MVVELSLPKEKSIPSVSLSDYSVLLYGEEKIGKTTLAAQFPDAMFLMCEPGSKALSIYGKPINTWTELRGYLKLLASDKRFKTIVIDTVDIAYLHCENFACEELNVKDISDAEWGKGWRKITAEFTKWMSYAGRIGKGIVYISHSTEKEIRNRSGGVRHRTVPTMPQRAADVLEPMVDIWCYYKYGQDGSRSLVLRGTEEVSAGVRTPDNFKGYTEIPGGRSPQEAYRNFVAAFENKLILPGKPKLGMRIGKK